MAEPQQALPAGASEGAPTALVGPDTTGSTGGGAIVGAEARVSEAARPVLSERPPLSQASDMAKNGSNSAAANLRDMLGD